MALTHGFFFRNILNIFFLYFFIFNSMNKVFNTFTESQKRFFKYFLPHCRPGCEQTIMGNLV